MNQIEDANQVDVHGIDKCLPRNTFGQRRDPGVGHHDVELAQFGDPRVDSREDLTSGATIEGPAALQSAYTTMILQLGDRATCLPDGNIRIAVG